MGRQNTPVTLGTLRLTATSKYIAIMRLQSWLLLLFVIPLLSACGDLAPSRVTIDLKDSQRLIANMYAVEPNAVIIEQTVNGSPFYSRVLFDCISKITVKTEKTYALTGAIVGSLAGALSGASIEVAPGFMAGLKMAMNVQLCGMAGCLAGAILGQLIPARDPVFATPFQKGIEKLKSYASFPDDYPGVVDSTYHCQ